MYGETSKSIIYSLEKAMNPVITNSYKVSILVPIYGVEKYIERCAVSLLEQTYDNIEYIFVNDCTKDNSICILRDVISRYPNRKAQVKIINHDVNKGLGAARNTAVSNASGEYVIHVDSDDYVHVNLVSSLVNKAKESNADIVSCAFIKEKNDKKIVYDFSLHRNPKSLNYAIIKHDLPNNIWGRLIRRSLYIDNDIYVSNGVNMSEDLNVLPRLIYYSTIIESVNDILYHYDCSNQNSYTSSFSEVKAKQSWETVKLLETFFSGDDYLLNALYFRKVKTYFDQLKKCVLRNNDRKLYYLIREKLNTIPHLYLKVLDYPSYIAMSITYYPLFLVYVRFASLFKR